MALVTELKEKLKHRKTHIKDNYLLKFRLINFTIVLDLDETLVSNRDIFKPHIFRPYIHDCLKMLRELPATEIIVWTASTNETGSIVIDDICKDEQYFDNVIYRNDKWFTKETHTKNMKLLGRDLNRCIIFDNSPQCIKMNKSCGIIVEDFIGNITEKDHTLLNIAFFCKFLLSCFHYDRAITINELMTSPHNRYSYPVKYAIPEGWENIDLGTIDESLHPVHGIFNKLHSCELN